jgi:hypothetical protein
VIYLRGLHGICGCHYGTVYALPYVPVDAPYIPVGTPYIPVGAPYAPVDASYVPVDVPYVPADVPYVPVDTPYTLCDAQMVRHILERVQGLLDHELVCGYWLGFFCVQSHDSGVVHALSGRRCRFCSRNDLKQAYTRSFQSGE